VNLEYGNRRLAYAFAGGDKSGWDSSQLPRLPIGVNAKYEPNWNVRIVYSHPDRLYTLDAFNGLPDHPQLLLDTSPEAFNLPSTPVDRELLLSRLRDTITVRLQQQLNKRQPDRSRALW